MVTSPNSYKGSSLSGQFTARPVVNLSIDGWSIPLGPILSELGGQFCSIMSGQFVWLNACVTNVDSLQQQLVLTAAMIPRWSPLFILCFLYKMYDNISLHDA